MKRLAAAVACALLLHAGFFRIGSDWFMHGTVPPSASRPVTVTMSYRQTQEQAAAGPRAMPAPGRPGHRPAVEKPAQPRSAQLSAQEPVSNSERKDTRDAGGENSSAAVVQGAAGGDGSGVGSEAVPLYKVNPPPRYPESARRRGVQGTVVLSVHVDEQGRVSNLWLFDSSGCRALDNAALQAVREWVFEPGMQGGRAVAMWVRVPVRFELQ